MQSGSLRNPLRNRHLLLAVLPPAALLLALAAASAASAAAPTGGEAAPEQAASAAAGAVTLNMRDADIRAVIHWLGNTTGRRFTIDPRVRGNLSIYAKEPLSVDNAYGVVLEALRINGYEAIESDGVVRIVPDLRAKTLPSKFVEALGDGQSNDLVTYILQLHNLPAEEVVAQLKPLIPPAGHLSAVAPRTVLLIDARTNVKRIARLAEYIDEGGAMEFEIIPLRHAPAGSVREILLGMIPDGKQSQAIAVDERSNSLLFSGSPSQRRQWRQIVQSLDNPQVSEGNTRVFYLKYLNAAELLPVLRGVTGNIRQAQEGKVAQASTVNIEALEATNAIVVNGPATYIDEIAKIIEQTDYRRAQVMVDAIIVEVSDDFARDIGVQWQTAFGEDGAAAATNFGLLSLGPGGVPVLGRGLSLGILHAGDLRALLQAVTTTVDANILSRPSIITLDNEEAEILVGQNIPLITGQSTSGAAPTENPFTTIERKDIGITLRVTPQINKGDAITLDVVQEVENISPSATAEATDVVTNKRSVKTKVLIADQDILVLGGLIDTTDQTRVRKVPLLGDVPLLGALFRRTEVQKMRRNLMVFIQPTILDDPERAEAMTRDRYELSRRQQQRFNDDRRSPRDDVLLPEFEAIAPQR